MGSNAAQPQAALAPLGGGQLTDGILHKKGVFPPPPPSARKKLSRACLRRVGDNLKVLTSTPPGRKAGLLQSDSWHCRWIPST